LLGFRSSSRKESQTDDQANGDVAKLFFDSFSKRVEQVEGSVRVISSELEKLKGSIDRGQMSDLVLLDRLKRAEDLVKESVLAIRASVDKALGVTIAASESSIHTDNGVVARNAKENQPDVGSMGTLRMSLPIGEIGSLPSITTTTELQVLTLLATEGPKSAPEIGRSVARSREHTARLMKKLYQEGYIRRDQTRIPFKYSVVEKVKQTFEKGAVKGEAKESVSLPQI
jgi:predicted transcriptional regulator